MTDPNTQQPSHASLTDNTPLAQALRSYGLFVIGCLTPDNAADLTLPSMRNGKTPEALILIANAGPIFWDRFQAEHRNETDPMDGWTRRILEPIAETFGMEALFPFDGPPFLPFHSWGYAARAFYPSPNIPAIHPVFGSWFGLRAAFLSPQPHPYPHEHSADENPCDSCSTHSCFDACLSNALSREGYDIKSCLAHVAGDDDGFCLANGCRARRACPVGQDYIYSPEQAEFHMRGFLTMLDRL
jgi:hypothetical protein